MFVVGMVRGGADGAEGGLALLAVPVVKLFAFDSRLL